MKTLWYTMEACYNDDGKSVIEYVIVMHTNGVHRDLRIGTQYFGWKRKHHAKDYLCKLTGRRIATSRRVARQQIAQANAKFNLA